MGLFDNMLKSDETLFLNEDALDFNFIPKELPYRENEQKHIATCIAPLFQNRTGRNLLIHGAPGIGKTAGIKAVFRELEEKTDDIIPIYINCWQKNTTFKILIEICDQIGYKFTHNKKTDELYNVVQRHLNKTKTVLCFDEIDKADDLDFLYYLIEEIYKKSIILITNYKDWMMDLDSRIKSRLNAETLEFNPYNEKETAGIIVQRSNYAFKPNVWQAQALDKAAEKTWDTKDIRSGLYLLKEAGLQAEERSSRKIELKDIEKAIKKHEEFTIKKQSELSEESQLVLTICQNNFNKKIGELFKLYQKQGGKSSYKTFQRKIRNLAENKFISTKRITGGTEGTTTIIKQPNKTLNDF